MSMRIAKELELDFNEPYIEIVLIRNNSTFVAKKEKCLRKKKQLPKKHQLMVFKLKTLILKKKKNYQNKKFSYSIKVADFYYKTTAETMKKQLKIEHLKKFKNIKIIINKI